MILEMRNCIGDSLHTVCTTDKAYLILALGQQKSEPRMRRNEYPYISVSSIIVVHIDACSSHASIVFLGLRNAKIVLSVSSSQSNHI